MNLTWGLTGNESSRKGVLNQSISKTGWGGRFWWKNVAQSGTNPDSTNP